MAAVKPKRTCGQCKYWLGPKRGKKKMGTCWASIPICMVEEYRMEMAADGEEATYCECFKVNKELKK
jgi:hypothetical protein